jgi:hypothetical protein
MKGYPAPCHRKKGQYTAHCNDISMRIHHSSHLCFDDYSHYNFGAFSTKNYKNDPTIFVFSVHQSVRPSLFPHIASQEPLKRFKFNNFCGL